AHTPRPDEIVDSIRGLLHVIFGIRRLRQRPVERIEDENSYLCLCRIVLSPTWHRFEERAERGQQTLTRLLQPFPVGLADAFAKESRGNSLSLTKMRVKNKSC